MLGEVWLVAVTILQSLSSKSRRPAATGDVLSHAKIDGSSLVLTFQDRTPWSYHLSGDYSGDTFTIRSRMVNDALYEELTLQPANPKIAIENSKTPTNGANPILIRLYMVGPNGNQAGGL